MKKKILVPIMALAIAVTAGVNYKMISASTNNSFDLSQLVKNAFAECEDTITTTGKTSTTKLCERKTSLEDKLVGIKCGTTSTSSCSYSNY